MELAMSINPVPGTGPATDAELATVTTGADSTAPAQANTASAPPRSGTNSKQEIRESPRPQSSSEMARDEVHVQRDNGANGEIVIRYVDPSGNLILQIPSSQVLGLARAIEQALEEQAKLRTDESRT